MKPMKNPTRALLACARRYRTMQGIAAKTEERLASLRRRLLAGIPAGEECAGVQHHRVVLLSADEQRLRRLGHWAAVAREAADAEKLRALARLMPSLLKAGAIRRTRTSRLVVRP